MSLRTDDRGTGTVGIVTLLASLVATAVVAGLIAAGLAMPAIGAAGATARGGVGFFDALPAELEQTPLSQQSRILAADGSTLATFYSENRIVVPLKSVAPIMRKAQVAIEDTRFYEHGGIDPRGVIRAAVNNASSENTQGASTLTQQYVKLTLQENAIYAGDEEAAAAAVRKDVSRKIQEMKYAIALEKDISKDQILEGYLNIAYFGDGAYGVETAARHYFGKRAAKLSLAEAALLAGVVQQPGRFDPTSNPKAAVDRRNVVLARMLQTGVITKKQHDAAVKVKLRLKVSKTGNGCDTSRAAFFCDYVYNVLTKDQILAKTPREAKARILRGGLTIRTTVDPKLQAYAQRAVDDKVTPRNADRVAAAISVVEPGTGKVLAMAQSQPFGRNAKKGQTVVNYNTDYAYGGSRGFPTGSTFKAFTLAAAIDEGRAVNSTLNAPVSGYTFKRSDFKPGDCIDLRPETYPVRNSEGDEHGTRTLREFTYKSVNTAFVKLQGEIGTCKVKDTAENLGIHLAQATPVAQPDGKPSQGLRPYGSLTLGTEYIAPLTMAAGYAAFAADGVYCAPVSITSVTALGGKQVAVPKAKCSQGIEQNVARGVTSALQDVLTKGTGRGNGIGRDAAGKTGTTNDSTNLWFVGYTPQLSAAVWFGHPRSTETKMKNISTGRKFYGGYLFGATVSAPIWSSFMRKASEGLPRERFSKASSKTIYGDLVEVPQTWSMSVDQARAFLEGSGFSTTVGGTVESSAPQGSVAGTSPGAGARVVRGTTITIQVSSGPKPQQPSPSVTKPPDEPGDTATTPPKPRKPRKPRKPPTPHRPAAGTGGGG